MNKIFILVFIIANLKADAQSYTPLNLDTTSFWVFDYYAKLLGIKEIIGEKTAAVIGDTTILGNKYFDILIYSSAPASNSLDSFTLSYYMLQWHLFVREDTLLKKVFEYDFITSSDLLAIDYNLNVGDTLQLIGSCQLPVSVDSINYKNILGVSRKFQHLHTVYNLPPYASIEGVGATFNFPQCGCGEWGFPEFILKCYNKNGIKLYGDTVSNCVKNIPLSIPELEIRNVNYNFTGRKLFIKNIGHEKLEIEIINSMGSTLFKHHIMDNSYSREFDSLPSGIYLLQITGPKTHLREKILIH